MGDSTIRAKLQDLYSRIPAMQCKPGCHDCCNQIQWLPEEWERIKHQKPAEPTSGGESSANYCPYASTQGCTIYEQRAFICRIFGTVDDPRLRCPHSCKPAHLLTAEEGLALLKKYAALF